MVGQKGDVKWPKVHNCALILCVLVQRMVLDKWLGALGGPECDFTVFELN